jgi:hypothetical protein
MKAVGVTNSFMPSRPCTPGQDADFVPKGGAGGLAPLHAWAGYLAALASQRRLQAERGPLVQVTIRQVLVLAGQRPDGIAQLLHQRRAG